MKDVFRVISDRRSVRDFLAKDVPEKYIHKIISAAVLAPSGGNQKNWSLVIVRSKNTKHDLKKAVTEKIKELSSKVSSPRARKEFLSYAKYFTFFSDAPVVIAVVMKPYDSLTARILKRYEANSDYMANAGVQSVAAAIENMLLAAAALGLGSCWMTGPLIAKSELERILEISQPDNLLAIIPLGYASKKPKPHPWPKVIETVVKEIK
ncbi:MAG: nitroreductase family protein [Candidatus Omnitrophota bacterium]|nr:nitroreductase family protein [Candidatus Omnitrophota bacterium]